MNKMMRIMGIIMALLMLVSMSAMADPGNGNSKDKSNNGRGNAYGHMNRELKDYHKFGSKTIEINGEEFESYDRPVIKDGRTLMPVRSLVAALGGTVLYDEDKGIATIIRYDELVMIEFYLRDEDGLILIYERDETDDDWGDGEEIETDVHPGVIEGRTFAPLRFLAVNFGFRVGWDGETSKISIDNDGPELDPDEVEITQIDELEDDIDIDVDLNDHTFIGILDEDDDYLEEDEDYTTSGALEVQLEEDYVEDMLNGTTVLKFEFEDEDGDTVYRKLKIKVKVQPSLVSEKEDLQFEDEDLDVEFDLNGWEFDGLKVKGWEFEDDQLDELSDSDDWGDVDSSGYDLDKDDEELTLTLLENDLLDELADDLEDIGKDEVEFRVIFERDGEDDFSLDFEVDFEDYLD